MNRLTRSIIWFGALVAATCTVQAGRTIQSLNDGWRFALGEHAGAEAPALDDAQWRQVDLARDWAMEGPYARDAIQGDKGGYRPSGIGWYRRAFGVSTGSSGRRLRGEFDGAYMSSEIWVNGHRPYGYISFGYDLTPYLRPGRNVLAVRLDNSRWMRERWNHACVVIWGAQNESLSAETGKARDAVRHLDLSNRPWDSDWGLPGGWFQYATVEEAASSCDRFMRDAFARPYLIGHFRCQYLTIYKEQLKCHKQGLLRPDGTPFEDYVAAGKKTNRDVLRQIATTP